jgi:hypothetical protein
MRWESSSIVLAGAVAAEGDEADSEADYEKVSDPDSNNSSTGVVCQCGRQREYPRPPPFVVVLLLPLRQVPFARNVCRPPSRRCPRPPSPSLNSPGSSLLRLHLLQPPPPPRPAQSPIFAPTSSSPFQISPHIHDEAPQSARATRAAPLRTHARSVLAVCGPLLRCALLPRACELLGSLDSLPMFGSALYPIPGCSGCASDRGSDYAAWVPLWIGRRPGRVQGSRARIDGI